jgi:hypothetical protein
MVGLIVIILLCSGSLWAQLPGKLFLGGGIGSSFVETSPTDLGGEDVKIDGNGFAYKFFAGYKFVRLIGVEGGYRSLGTIKNTVQNTEIESNVKGFDLFGTATFNFTMLEVFAKAGYFFSDNKFKKGDITENTSSSDFSWGVGAEVSLGKLGVRAEWESLKVEGLENPAMLTASVLYIIM